MQKAFIWSNRLLKSSTKLCIIFFQGVLRNFETNSKITNFQSLWNKRLESDNFIEWELIPLKVI